MIITNSNEDNMKSGMATSNVKQCNSRQKVDRKQGEYSKDTKIIVDRSEQISDVRDGIALTISSKGKAMFDDQATKDNARSAEVKEQYQGEKTENSRSSMESLLKSYEDQAKSGQAEKKAYENLGKILEIARRISRGDKVPVKDERKLMEFSSELYQTAKAAAMLNASKDHKKYKSIFDDEDQEEFESKVRALEKESNSSGFESIETESSSTDSVGIELE